MSSSNCCFLTCIQISQEAGQVVWYSHLFQNFPQFIVIHTVKGFGIINKAGIEGVRERECLCSRPGPLALHLDLWYWRCQWAGPGLWSEVVCLWTILTFREMLPDSQAWGAAWPCSCLPWGARCRAWAGRGPPGQGGAHLGREGHTWTRRDSPGQGGTHLGREGPTWTGRDTPGQGGAHLREWIQSRNASRSASVSFFA